MSSHLDTLSGDLRRSVKDLLFSSNNATETAVHHMYANTATRRPSASITQMDSVRSDDSDIGSPDYMSDVSSGAPEIVVWSGEVDRGDMESDEDVLSSPEALPGSPPPVNELNQSLLHDRLPASHPSSTSALSDLSELSSIPSTHSSQATTPNTDPSTTKPIPPAPMRPQRSSYLADLERPEFAVLPKSSIPTDIPLQQYAAECIMAAEESRLNPYALHPEEYHLLRHHISHNQVTTYLNIRNGILRMWLREPWRAVARKAAVGCANARWYDAASVCYDWLVRRGYINFGCVNYDVPTQEPPQANATKRRKTVAVVGAGISGLGCARQLDGLFQQYASRFWDRGEEPPKVIILEGRSRVGGRVYSREFKTKPAVQDPEFQGKRHTAEMGGMIITGFDRGNPMNILVRGQLGLPYHALTPETTIYDSNGKPVDPDRDQLVEKLYNDCLDRVSEYKTKTRPHKVIEGNRDLIEDGRDSHGDGSKTIIEAEEARAALPHAQSVAEQSVPEPRGLVPVSSDRVTGRSHNEPGVPATTNASDKAQSIGFDVNFASAGKDNVDLNQAAASDGATLGSVLDNAITQYKHLVDLNALDHRLVNWHVANLEYSNATNLNNLSLGLWDIDAGNEFDGSHTMVVGGYQSVARGLLQCPKPLEIRAQAAATKISYTNDHFKGPVTIDCEDGSTIDADAVVCTVPLGVLKKGNVVFEPELPSWKTGAIDRLGFGALNKVVLVYDKVFWDPARHIFGVLQDAPSRNSTTQQEYGRNRGRFFQWFNISSTTGLPCLLALMAGDAGFDTEHTSNDVLVAEATQILRGVFGNDVPYPVEAVVTRWGSDRFARGSYSSAAPGMLPDDYDSMARSVGNLFFAGEHTIGTHPATVHGAFLSGLRAASEVLEAMLGPIEVPTPLVLPKDSLLVSKRKAPAQDPRQARLEAYEWEIWDHIVSKIGDRPSPPAKVAGNAYLLFSKAHFEEAKRKCEENRKHSKGRSMANEVRVMTSKMWKDATPEQRRPFEEQVLEQKRVYAEALQKYEELSAIWNKEASALRTAYEKDHPSIPGAEELAHEVRSSMKHRRARNIHYGEDESDGEL